MLDTTAIEKLISKAQQFPALAHTYAAEIDRLLRSIGEKPLTFSATAWDKESMETVQRVGLQTKFADAVEITDSKVMLTAEALIKEGKRGDAFAHVFTRASGRQVNALNLFYANHASQSPSTRLHYLNKYLRSYGLGLTLKEDASADFFQRITSTDNAAKVDGPLVTVIMPAHNAENTIELALGSLLNQTWQNLQIIVVDDASTDGTLQKTKELAKRDTRIEVLSSPVNVGPYVCRNLGALHTRGQWLTVHDADDWAFPDRIEQQVKALSDGDAIACTGRMLRMNEQGQITRPSVGTSSAEDGYLRFCFVSLMVQTAFFRNELGAWDSVRVGGDAELIERVNVLNTPSTHLHRPLMLCLDHEACLTNHLELGLVGETGQSSPLRADYTQAFTVWHKNKGSKKLSAFGKSRPFKLPKANLIDEFNINKVFATTKNNFELINVSDALSGDTQSSAVKEVLPAVTTAEIYVPKRYIALGKSMLSNKRSDIEDILKANTELASGNLVGWQTCLNLYLSRFDVPPISIDARGDSIFDRLNTDVLRPVNDGPLVTVIMPAWNAEKTVLKAAQSILNQTWRNLELIIVDDASVDGTWEILKKIARLDDRVKIFKNSVNVGPYVSKNIALIHSRGSWIAGHDADDFAFPNRLEVQVGRMIADGILVSTAVKLRILENGFVKVGSPSANSDGVVGQAFISCIYSSDYLRKYLGSWDSVRFGADGEIIGRVKLFCKDRYQHYPELLSMICLDLPDGLTNNPTFGITLAGLSPPRRKYLDNYKKWHKSLSEENYKVQFPQIRRPFACDVSAEVPVYDAFLNICSTINGSGL